MSKIISVSFDSKKDKWTSDVVNTMCLKTYYDGNSILVLGDTKCAYYNSKGEFLTSYDYPSKLIDWDYRDGKIAMLFENEIKRQNYFTTIDSEKIEPNQHEFSNGSAKCIRLSAGKVLTMTKEGIMQYDFKGGGEKNINSESSYEKFILIDDYIFLLGYDRIDRIDYKG